jgi:hypothetical protein
MADIDMTESGLDDVRRRLDYDDDDDDSNNFLKIPDFYNEIDVPNFLAIIDEYEYTLDHMEYN